MARSVDWARVARSKQAREGGSLVRLGGRAGGSTAPSAGWARAPRRPGWS